ncbi:c-type cytochrome [Jiulongibacter sp. NS-SX5]|uniref:c-type cytochrome n=1 Tax=Jiulongibacter sp. NS-SX5 TaxID=3463854 RepID=UPI004059F42C
MKKNYFKLFLLSLTICFVWGFTSDTKDIPELKLQPGFKADHIFSPSSNDMGSWVAMCFDDENRLITSDQYGSLYRMTIPPIGSSNLKPGIEKIKLPEGETIGAAQGLLYAFNSLFVMVNNRPVDERPKKSGLYRLNDTNGDDLFDEVILMKELQGDGEHGPHSLVLGPDGKSIYVLAGNHTDFPDMDNHLLPKTWAYDNLLPAIPDPRGHANNRHAPGGWLAKVDPETNHWELVSGGYRNAFDLAFNDVGDLFVYDADMEWDFGLPWYRPTRICHATSGSEFGWRTGNGKWSPSFEDNLPAILNIGQGSPTNLVYLKDARFPQKYRQSLLAFDWSFGIMHAIHLSPEGSTYTATREEFLSGIPLPLTDGVIGPDGALYFMTGGRKLQSDLYRVYYEGNEMVAELPPTELTEANQLRRSIEAQFDTESDANIALAWQNLNHEDRNIRYAARVLLEHQNLEKWQSRLNSEGNLETKLTALLALVRSTKNNKLIPEQLNKVAVSELTEKQLFDFTRIIELGIARNDGFAQQINSQTAAQLNAQYPHSSWELNRQLCKVLVNLNVGEVVPKTMALIKTSKDEFGENTATSSSDLILRNPQYGLDIAKMLEKVPPMQQTYLATALSDAKIGWTPKLRKAYFEWFRAAFDYKGGNSYVGFIDRARKNALTNVPEKDRDKYNEISGGQLLSDSGNDLKLDDYPKGPWRTWNLEDAVSHFEEPLAHRNFSRGKAMYVATTCNRCHSIGGDGGNIGPDLTRIGTRFSEDAILEAIIDPSKSISDQYAATEFQLKDGSTIVGKIINETNEVYSISQNPYAPDYLVEVQKKEVERKQYSSISIMLPGLINSLNEEELKDLVAYLVAGGDEQHKVFE